MKISVEFDSMEEFEAFRTSGKKTRTKGQVDTEETMPATAVAAVATQPAAPQFVAPPSHGFPGAATNGATPPPQTVHPLVSAILNRIDGSIATGQTEEAIMAWFRQQIGPDAAQATLDQLKQIILPRMSEAQLRQIAPQLGITG
jgi:hypothetical protein